MYTRLHSSRLSYVRGSSSPRPRARSAVEGDGRRPSRTDIPLPQGVWWLKHANVKEEAAYGDSFVIHRPQDTELMMAPRPCAVQVWHPGAPWMHRSPYRLLPPEFDSDVVEVEYVSLEEETSALALTGVGPVVEPVESPRNPRRTQKVKFTCNRCRTRTEKFVNPIAWNRGVVFCRCDGCHVVHLIRDEKGVFSCLKGPLFTQSMDPEKIPKGLPQHPKMPNEEEDAEWLS